MSDPTDMMALATHGGAGVAGAGLVGAFMRWLAGREAAEARDEFVGLRHDVKSLISDMQEHKAAFRSVVITEEAVKAMHKRFDALESRVKVVEERRRR